MVPLDLYCAADRTKHVVVARLELDQLPGFWCLLVKWIKLDHDPFSWF